MRSTKTATSFAPSTTFTRDCAVSSAMLLPFFTASMEDSINAAVSLAASELLAAKLRTSSATTAKPLPAAPALAASTEAFRAKILVWKAISSMALIIFTISVEVFRISFIAETIFCIS